MDPFNKYYYHVGRPKKILTKHFIENVLRCFIAINLYLISNWIFKPPLRFNLHEFCEVSWNVENEYICFIHNENFHECRFFCDL